MLLTTLLCSGVTTKAQNAFVCTFENNSDTAGWMMLDGNATNTWAIGNATAQSGSKCLYISNNNGTNYAYSNNAESFVYAYKELSLASGSYEISFDWKGYGENNWDYLRVFLAPANTTAIVADTTPIGGVSSNAFANAAPPAGWIDLAGGQLSLDSTWSNILTDFIVPTAGNYKLVFFWANDGSGGTNPPAAVDNIMLRQPSCPTPINFAATAVTDESFTLTWSEVGNATQWLVRIADSTTRTTHLVSDTTYTVSGLTPNAGFDVSVASLCGIGDTSYWRTLTNVRTANCVRISSLPYTYDFEDASGNGGLHTINPCWTKATSYISTSTHYPYPSNTQKHSGSYALYLYSNSSAVYSYAVTPMFDEDLSLLQANFYLLKTSASYGHVKVGVMENPNDIRTFTALADLQPQSTNTWELFEVPFTNYTGTGRFIAFVCNQMATNYAYLDDITIDYLPSCPRPSDLVFSDTTTTEITLSWTENGTLTTSWLIEYGTKGFELGQGTQTETFNNNEYTLSDLTPNTIYDIYLRSICSDGDTSTLLHGTFATLCGELELPVLFDFESAEAGTAANGRPMPYCWNRINDASGTANYYPYVAATAINALSGTQYLYFYQSTTQTQAEHQYAILPSVNTSSYPMNSNEIVFWAKVTSTTASELIVGVMTDPTADSTFVAVDTVTIATGGYHIYTVNFANYEGDGQYIALLGRRFTGSPYTCVDDIEVRVASSCPTVENPVTLYTTHTSATLSWDGNELQSVYNVYFGEEGFDAENVTPEVVADTFITLYNLQPNTRYEYYLVAECADGNVANTTARYTFQTACNPIVSDSLPYIEDFESYGTGSTSPISECWTKGTSNSTAYPYPHSGTANLITGNRVLYFMSNTSHYCYATLPLFEDDLTSLRLRFNVKRDNTTSPKSIIQVGVMSNPNDISTFETIETINLSNEPINTIRAIEIILDQYTGSGSYIAFYAAKTSSGNNYIYIDDVVVDPIPACRRPVALSANTITSSGASLSWNCASTSSSYTIALGTTADFDPDTCTNLFVTNSTNYTLSSLNENTHYYWAVQANCGIDEISEWSDRTNFQTPIDCGPNSINIVDTIGIGGGSSAAYTFYASTSYTLGFSGHIYSAEELNEMGLQSNNSINSISLHCATTGGTIPGASIYLAETDQETFNSTLSDTIDRATMTRVFYGDITASAGQWLEIAFDSAFAYSGARNLMIVMTRDSGTCAAATSFYYTTTNPTYKAYYGYRNSSGITSRYRTYYRADMIFNICTEVPACSRPTDVAITGLYSDNASFSWIGESTQYEIAYDTAGFNPDTIATLAGHHLTLSSAHCTLTGLTPSTHYQLYVRSICANDVSPWSLAFDFRTACTPQTLPYHEDFETYGTGASQNINPCWTKGTNYTTQYPYPCATNAINGDRSLYFYGYRSSSATALPYYSYTALPLFDAPIDTLSLTFKMRRYSNVSANYTSLLYVGVMIDPSNPNTFTAIDTIDLKEADALSIHGIEVAFNNYQGNGNYIALYAPAPQIVGSSSTSYNYAYVDDVKVDYISTCPAPTAIIIDSVTTTTAVLHWNDRTSNPAGYELEYGFRGFEQGTGTVVSSTGNPTTLTGLTPGTHYEVYVRTLCNATEAGPWSVAFGSFTTECAPINTLPVTYDFENDAAGTAQPLPICWNRINDAPSSSTVGYYPYINNTASNAHSGTHCLYFYYYNTSSNANNQLAVLPEIDTTVYPINTLEIVFWGKSHITASYDHTILVGMMTDPNDISTFTAVDTVTLSATIAEYTVSLENYTGNGTYPAFRKTKGSASYGHSYIDDITIDVISSCGRPDSLAVVATTANSAILAWSDTIGATAWSIEYSEIGGATATVIANSNPFTLTGLTPATYYHFRVASYCDNGDLGGYSRIRCHFTTDQIVATLPYSYTFEDGSEWNNWQTISNQNVNWFRGTATAGEGNYSIYISADSGATRSTNMNQVVNACAYRDIDFGTTPSSFTVTFKVNAGGTTTANYDGVSVLLVDPTVYVEPSTTNITSPWGHVNNLSLGTVRHTNDWESRTFYFDNVSDVQRMVFYWFNQSTGIANFVGDPAAIDSIVVQEQPCQRPYDLSVDTITATTATLNWGGNATDNYEITYRVAGTDTSNNTRVYATGNSATLTGLNSQTEYVFWVRHLCSNTLMSDYSENLHFTTECSFYRAADTFYEDFHTTPGAEYDEEGQLPLCWEGYSNGTDDSYIPHVVTSGSYWYTASDSSAITLTSGSDSQYGNTKIVRLPLFAEPINSLTLSYWMCTESTTNGTLSVGYLTGDNLATDFVAIKNIPASASTAHSGNGPQPTHGLYDTVSFDSVPAEAMYIAFKWYYNSTYYSVAIDNVKVTSDVTCSAPHSVIVTHDYANATLNWSGTATSYEVNVKAQADANWPAEVTVNDASSYTFTGLTPATTYLYRLRALCEDGSMSNWTEGTFTTDSLPCFAPANLVATPAIGSVEMNWTNGSDETTWNLHVWNTAFDQLFDVTTNPATVTGLTPGTTYQAAVQAVCGGGVIASTFSDTISFTTDVCDPVSGVTVDTNGTDAVVSWTAGDNNTGNFAVEYGYSGFAAGEGTTITATATTITLSNLEEETSYDVYVRAICDNQYNSSWSDVVTFSTGKVGILTAEGNNLVTIYPNPAEQSTTIRVSGMGGEIIVTIVDMNGRTVSTTTLVCSSDCEKTMNVTDLAAGNYFVRLQGNGFNAVKKLIVK